MSACACFATADADRSQKSQYTMKPLCCTLLLWVASALVVPRQQPRRPPLRLATVEDVPRGGAVPPLLRNKTPVEAVGPWPGPPSPLGCCGRRWARLTWYIGRLGKKELEAMGAASLACGSFICWARSGPSACKL